MDNPISRHLIGLIKQKAIAKWGEDYWFSELVRAYVAAENAVTGQSLKSVQRQSQLDRLFKEDSTKINNPEVVKL